MKFMFANCKVCNRDVFNEEELVAFFKRSELQGMERANLEGQQPWTGMLCICLQCVNAIAEAA
jgi:hypothetical protein